VAILNMFDLRGKNALVTGSSRGLGAGMAIALAEAGANVAVHGSAEKPAATLEAIRKLGVKQAALVADLRETKACDRLIEETVEAFGSIDILVNNAGMIRRAPAEDFSEADWSDVIWRRI
jgi:2-deoxy-D-gluconate 3-dehydrogenase